MHTGKASRRSTVNRTFQEGHLRQQVTATASSCTSLWVPKLSCPLQEAVQWNGKSGLAAGTWASVESSSYFLSQAILQYEWKITSNPSQPRLNRKQNSISSALFLEKQQRKSDVKFLHLAFLPIFALFTSLHFSTANEPDKLLKWQARLKEGDEDGGVIGKSVPGIPSLWQISTT